MRPVVTHDPQYPVSTPIARALGEAPNATVGIRNFDTGIVETLGGTIEEVDTGKGPNANYFVKSGIVAVQPPPGLPGVPITFQWPEDVYERFRIPVFVISRDDIAHNMSRWHPGKQIWNAPARGANPVSHTIYPGTRGETTVEGWDRYETKEMDVPFDITYTIKVLARYQGRGNLLPKGEPVGFDSAGGSPINQLNSLFDYVIRRFPPYGQLYVRDSLGDYRLYSTFLEAISSINEVNDVTDRTVGHALTIRVEAELDLSDPITYRAVTGGVSLSSTMVR